MGESQTLKGPFTKWNALWNLNMPPRLRNFLWQAVKGILPTVVNLRARGVDVEPIFPCLENAQEAIDWNGKEFIAQAVFILNAIWHARNLLCWKNAPLKPASKWKIGDSGDFVAKANDS
nr:uncharacterized protein LOC109156589 [Ipomoea batatas]